MNAEELLKKIEVMVEDGNHGDIIKLVSTACEVDPQIILKHPQLLFYRGYAEGVTGKPNEAIKSYMLAIEHGFRRSGIYFNLGNALRIQKAPEQALVYYQEACRLTTERWPIYTNMALCFDELGDIDSCDAFRIKAYEENSENDTCRFNYSYSLMRNGKIEEGLRLYESRVKTVPNKSLSVTWSNETELAGKKVLVVQEQGIGDVIMFGGLVKSASKRFRETKLICNNQLKDVLNRSIDGVEVVSSIAPEVLSDFDERVGVCSMAHILAQQGLNGVPVKPYLIADPKRVSDFKKKLYRSSKLRTVGIAWKGGSTEMDRSRRSIPLARIIREAGLSEDIIINLQYGDTTDEVEEARQTIGVEIVELNDSTFDIEEVLAAVSSVDEIVSVQQSVVHFAGALGKKVRVLVPFTPEWRYGREDSRMIWWESPVLYRQKEKDVWDKPLNDLRLDLEQV